MEKEFINLNIGKQNVIKIDDYDDTEENTCGQEKNTIIKHVKILNKMVCYKCKINSSKFYNRNEYICEYCFLI